MEGRSEEIKKANIQGETPISTGEELGVLISLAYIYDNILQRQITNTRFLIYTDSKITTNKLLNRKIQERHIPDMRKIIRNIQEKEVDIKIIWVKREQLRNIERRIDNVAKEAITNPDTIFRRHRNKKDIKKIEIKQKHYKWQTEWTIEHSEKLIGKIIPRVGTDRINLSFKTTQIITGHGHMQAYYHRFKLRDRRTM